LPFHTIRHGWYNIRVSEPDAFIGLPIEVDDRHVRRWRTILVQAVFAILAVGVVLSAILWAAVSGEVGALVLSIAFAACAGLLIIRQALLAERA
jgi:hypothetical protein